MNPSRRSFLSSVGAGGLVLATNVLPTQASGDLGAYADFVNETGQGVQPARKFAVTEDNILGPFHRPGAPFRAKITPPMEPGTVLLVSGQVFGFDTRKPLPNAVIDIWQANADGRYDNDDPRRPPAKDVFLNRARIVTDENGYYEYETIKPAPYQIGRNRWRPSHIHYWVRHTKYKPLITQLYFRGDDHQKTDAFIKSSLIIDLANKMTRNKQAYKSGKFDIVLAPAKA